MDPNNPPGARRQVTLGGVQKEELALKTTIKEEFKERTPSHRGKQIVSGLAHGPFSLGPARDLSLKRSHVTAANRSRPASFEETTTQNARVFNDQDELFSESPSPVDHKEEILPSFDFTSALDVPLSSPGSSFFNFDLISNTAKLIQRENLFFVQLPHILPSIDPNHLADQLSTVAVDCVPRVSEGAQDTIYSDPLVSGKIGKLAIFRSGKVRLQIGSMNFVVDSGLDHLFSESIVQVNSVKTHLVNMGPVHSRLVVYPELTGEPE